MGFYKYITMCKTHSSSCPLTLPSKRKKKKSTQLLPLFPLAVLEVEDQTDSRDCCAPISGATRTTLDG